jgi:hypothetical protein
MKCLKEVVTVGIKERRVVQQCIAIQLAGRPNPPPPSSHRGTAPFLIYPRFELRSTHVPGVLADYRFVVSSLEAGLVKTILGIKIEDSLG